MPRHFPIREAKDIVATINSQAFATNGGGCAKDLVALIDYAVEQVHVGKAGFPASILAGQQATGAPALPSNEEVVAHLQTMIDHKEAPRDSSKAAPNIPWAQILQWAIVILSQILGGFTPPAPAPAPVPGPTPVPAPPVVASKPGITVAGSPNPSAHGESVALTATVAGTIGMNGPTGTVTFLLNKLTVLGTETLSPAADSSINATAAFSTSSLPVGSNLITATYEGDPSNAPATSDAYTQTVS